jgi:hypothetical protein
VLSKQLLACPTPKFGPKVGVVRKLSLKTQRLHKLAVCKLFITKLACAVSCL